MRREEIEGLKVLCKYSKVPNKLGYCGKKKSFMLFESFLKKPTQEKAIKIRKLVDTFVGLSPYLKLISNSNGLNKFDFSVVKAYWIGNKLLENINKEEVKKMILEEFAKPGLLPYYFAEKKAHEIKNKVFPNHSFHVLYINFITRKVKPILPNLDNCLVKPAFQKSKKLFKTIRLSNANGKLKFVNTTKKFELKDSLQGTCSTHWNHLIEEITKNEEMHLKKYLSKNLELTNSCLLLSKHE